MSKTLSSLLVLNPYFISVSISISLSSGMEDLFSCGDTVGCSRVSASEPLMEKNYREYLRDARRVICASVQACGVWSAPYDGLNPSPDECREDEEEKEDDENVPAQTPTPQPPSDSERVELEWDDTYDATPDGDDSRTTADSSQHQDRPVPDEPPKHIQEMRKTAIMLIKGSYVEESEFQDDVLVYNLIAQKDTRDDRHTSIVNTTHNCTMNTRKPADSTQTHNHHVCANSPNARLRTQTVNGHASEEQKHECDVSHLDHNRNVTDHIKPSSASHDGQDFISQCLELIRHHGGEDESIVNDEEHLQRQHALLHEEEEDVDFTSFSDEDEEINATGSNKQGVPFTGQS